MSPIVTDIETNSMERPSRKKKRSPRVLGLVWTVVTFLLLSLLPAARPAAADSLTDAKARAAQISAQIQADGNRLDALAQQYEAAQQRVQQLDQQVAQTQAAISQTRAQVASDQGNLRAEALTAYMAGTTDTGFESVFAGGGEKASVDQEYRSVASGNITSAVDRLHLSQTALTTQEGLLQTTQAAATQASEQSTLSAVNGQIQTLVAQQEQAAAAAAAAAYAQKLAQQQAAQQQAAQQQALLIQQQTTQKQTQKGGGSAYTAPAAAAAQNVPVAPGASGAVAAAESQLGVPYVWGGESPGVGFDCSGLVQWAWGRAGVSLPRTAQGQYDAVTHIPMSALEAGDLVFWDDGTGSVQHVAIYVGGGTVIHAPSTGSVVRYQGIWGDGLVGAGRP
jgi:cell wall-associated NlpC family hydrolase